MPAWQIIAMLVGMFLAWALGVERASRNGGSAQLSLWYARLGLVAGGLGKVVAMTVNYFLAATALIKILRLEYIGPDPIIGPLLKGSGIAPPHLLALLVVGFSFGMASLVITGGQRLLEFATNNGWQGQPQAAVIELLRFAGIAAVAYFAIIHLDTNLMLFRTALMLYGNELNILSPGMLPDLAALCEQFKGTAGVWMLRLLQVWYPLAILGTTAMWLKAKERHEEASERVLEEEADLWDDEEGEEGNADDVAGGIQMFAPPMPIPMPGNNGGHEGGNNGVPWQRPVPANQEAEEE